jgi:hypothetical protein
VPVSTRASVRMVLTSSASRVLVTDRYGRDMLKAQLPPASQAHRLATRTLLEALALFCDARLRVVLSAESEDLSCAQGLSDGFGFGIDTLHYEVEIAASPAKRRRGVGRFHDVRRLRAVDGDEL